ncbi:HPP family protein [Catalinimonas alkaloidigena]|uniref:HPP family protein n=1 Tax=Catalinimonas alkaloidigena TaxID=1075417 RepID=A0A1G9RMM9_9BACT|nr:HPP family protein [Catalinimonas alkaloidigena]SDM24523.1 HPP family protein [Catalinimonas alkaloidigena]
MATPINSRSLGRTQFSIRDELQLALLPTVVVLVVLVMLEMFSSQRLLFSSLPSSAFLIYLAPDHRTNRMRTLLLAQVAAASVGFLAERLIGPNYWAASLAMLLTIVLMVSVDAMHPPAVSTALSFAFRGRKPVRCCCLAWPSVWWWS